MTPPSIPAPSTTWSSGTSRASSRRTCASPPGCGCCSGPGGPLPSGTSPTRGPHRTPDVRGTRRRAGGASSTPSSRRSSPPPPGGTCTWTPAEASTATTPGRWWRRGGSGALPRAWGAEVGTRLSLLDRRLDLAAALWCHPPAVGAGLRRRRGHHRGVRLPPTATGSTWRPASASSPGCGPTFDLTLAHAAYTRTPGTAARWRSRPTFTGQAGLSVLHPVRLARPPRRALGGRAAPATQDREGLPGPGVLPRRPHGGVPLALPRGRAGGGERAEQRLARGAVRQRLLRRRTGRTRRRPCKRPREDIHFTPGNPINARARWRSTSRRAQVSSAGSSPPATSPRRTSSVPTTRSFQAVSPLVCRRELRMRISAPSRR